MPTLEFKGKQHIYAHHLTVPYRPLKKHRQKPAPAIRPAKTIIGTLLNHCKFLKVDKSYCRWYHLMDTSCKLHRQGIK